MDNSKALAGPSNLFTKAFWITIFSLAGLFILLEIRHDRPAEQKLAYEVQDPVLRDAVAKATQIAVGQISQPVNLLIDHLYAPVYAGIPIYADFHYTVLGEYSELIGAALTNSSGNIEEMMFNGFDERLVSISAEIDTLFYSSFSKNLDTLVKQSLPDGVHIEELGPTSSTIIGDIKNRAFVTVPMGSAASIGGATIVKTTSRKIASQIAGKILLKSAAKATAKGSGMAAGAGTGAIVGSAFGPIGSVVGGVIGAAATWIVVDKVIIELSELYFREDFEADLKKSIDLDKEMFRSNVFAVLENKKKEVESFTLEEL